MAISVSIASKKMTSSKAMWSWVITKDNTKFGASPAGSEVVGEFVAIHSALKFVPEMYSIVFRTRNEYVVDAINNPRKTTNPIAAKIYQLINERQGSVSAVLVSIDKLNLEDKRSLKTVLLLTNSYKTKEEKTAEAAKKASSASSQQKLSASLKKTTKRAAPVKRAKPRPERLTNGLDDWDENETYESIIHATNKEDKGELVTCESCNAPISPLTNECLCSI